jgi:hypothetical protein
VIKLRNPEEAGEKIVVQGGTFLNESALRAIEKVLGRDVVRPDIAGIMGAYGCALYSLENWHAGDISQVSGPDDLLGFAAGTINARCSSCENKCMLTITKFGPTMETALKSSAPNLICAYIYELAGAANKFYHETPILKEENEDLKAGYIALMGLTKEILEQCIDLLGFEAPEKM